MSRIIIISNRLPVTVKKSGKRLEYIDSIGGLSTGLKKYHEEADSVWVGWPGIAEEELTGREKRSIEKTLKEKYNCLPVFLTQNEVNKYYFGFCNNTIWPLFHYFSSQTEYDITTWEAYCEVNQKFYDRMKSSIGKRDTIWVHDYQLMLLPEIIKRHHPNVQVGFFLHIPFPSAELFRLLVWREEILRGLLGADLIGFHTYDYVRHFLSCTRRLLGLDDALNVINYEDRYVKVDSFPMGIDYKRFSGVNDEGNLSPEVLEIKKVKETKKIILSIDRLDYSKGIPARIRAYNNFLTKYPQYIGKVRLNLIVAPSRTEIENYELLLKEIREMVSETNGTFGTMNWMPIWFLFKTFSQEELIALYRNSDVLLVTPLRDGMNLIAKEFVAARADFGGMLVLSETAGAASELAEAVIVNANDANSVALGILNALEMPEDEKIARNKIMHQRLQRYTVEVWAEDFLKQLKSTCEDVEVVALPKPIETNRDHIEKEYRNAKKRILFLDYDGTLVGFKAIPEQAIPDQDLKELLRTLIRDDNNTVVLISGRDRQILDNWFKDVKGLNLVASHGLWLKHAGQKWVMTASLENEWKESVRPIFELYADRMPGAIVEEKEFALSLHYRRCNPDMVIAKLNELKQTLVSMTKSSSLVVQEGSKVLELKDSKVNKGIATAMMIDHIGYDFLFGAGDDLTDEDIFRTLPHNAISVKVGLGRTAAKYRTKSWITMRKVLKRFAETNNRE
jgi:trehalose 6-phosphate synthase/phosphatase